MNKYEQSISHHNERHFWKGPDIATRGRATVGAHDSTSVRVKVMPSSIPVSLKYPEDFEGINASGRSRAAILGLEVEALPSLMQASSEGFFDSQGRIAKPFMMPVSLRNHGNRTIIIPSGFNIFRFYAMPSRSTIRGPKLKDILDSGRVKIQGEFGIGWDGIYVPIRQDLWRCPSNGEPTELQDENGNYRVGREWASFFYQDLPQDRDEIFGISETERFTIVDRKLEAVLDENVYDAIGGRIVAKQINSRLIDGGTDDPVWVETVGPTGVQKFVKFKFAENGFSSAT